MFGEGGAFLEEGYTVEGEGEEVSGGGAGMESVLEGLGGGRSGICLCERSAVCVCRVVT